MGIMSSGVGLLQWPSSRIIVVGSHIDPMTSLAIGSWLQ